MGKIGDDLRMDYTAQGQVVWLAQRMESLAAPDRIYLSDATARLVSGCFELADLGEFALKGVKRAGDRPRARRRGAIATALRRRDRARAHPLRRARRGHGDARGRARARATTGEARSSASWPRPVSARADSASSSSSAAGRAGSPCWKAARVSYGRNIPYLPMLELFRELVRDHGAGRRAQARARRSPAGSCCSTRASATCCRCCSSSSEFPTRSGPRRGSTPTRASGSCSQCCAGWCARARRASRP